ncbi:YscQ/HrcQ family type III secretion apparatus protein [Oxalobacteraceae bacterium CAVE-383]|nr:YscQ/HrcQ family type III secretion apparatus protein [Oxalobacteraceae bacterium CAVE-383]
MMNEVLQHAGYRPLPLARKDAALVAALAVLQKKSVPAEVCQEPWRLRFCGTPGPGAGPEAAIDAEWQGHRITAHIPHALLERTFALCLPDLSMRDIPDDLFPSMASNLIGAWLTGLPHIESLRIHNIDMRADASGNAADSQENRESRRIYLLACNNPPAIQGAVEYTIGMDLDPALLSSLPGLCGELPLRLPETAANFLRLPLPLQCEIGNIVLPCATFKTLRLGDILFFDSHMESDQADFSRISMRLTHRGHPVLHTRLHSPNLMIVTDTTMNDRKSFLFEDLLDDPDADFFNGGSPAGDFDEDTQLDPALPATLRSDRAGLGSLDQLPLQLVFDVGECEMRLSELQALQPGSLIPLASSRTEMVRVRVNGRVVASGELVEIDGKIGVMLARLADIQ